MVNPPQELRPLKCSPSCSFGRCVVRWKCPPPHHVVRDFSRLVASLRFAIQGSLPQPQVALAPAAWDGPAMRRPSLHGAGEFVSATWEMINGNFFECAAAAKLSHPL